MTLTTPELLTAIAEHRAPDDVVIATMTAGYLWPTVSTADRDFCYIAPMGSASSVGLGLALARPDLRVFVLDGDGSLLMNLGSLVTVAGHAPRNLVHVVLANGGYSITGGQPLPGDASSTIPAIARAAGIPTVREASSLDEVQAALRAAQTQSGPALLYVHVQPAYDRSATSHLTHLPQAMRTQGGPGFHRLRSILENAPTP